MNSVACALKFLQKAGYQAFANVDATVEFLTVINQLFDIMNSKNAFSKGYKARLSKRNWPSTRIFIIINVYQK